LQHNFVVYFHTDLDRHVKRFERNDQTAMQMKAAHTILAQTIVIPVAGTGPDLQRLMRMVRIVEHQACDSDAQLWLVGVRGSQPKRNLPVSPRRL
jgi:hypothetical protein